MPFVSFTESVITATEKGPQLPEPIVSSAVLPPSEQTNGRPAIQITMLCPVPEDTELQINKSKTRTTYGLGTAVELTLKDSDGNRLLFTGRLYAQQPKAEGSADEVAEGEE